MSQTPAEVLHTILGHLGFTCQIEEEDRDGHLVLQVRTPDRDALIGEREEVLQDLQLLVNRILQMQDRNSLRVMVDVEHYRASRDDAFVQKIKQLADGIRKSGCPVQTDPLNSYDRRLVHHAFANDPDFITSSPADEARLKCVTIRLREANI